MIIHTFLSFMYTVYIIHTSLKAIVYVLILRLPKCYYI